MTAPLFDVKNKFSEYVKLAEQGETIAVTRHGKPVVLVMGLQTFSEEVGKNKTSFAELYADWREKWAADTENPDNTTPWDNIRSKEIYQEKDVWGD